MMMSGKQSDSRQGDGIERPKDLAGTYYGEKAAGMYYLPFFRQIKLPPPPQEYPVLPSLIQESCGFKILSGAVMGSILGIGLGLFMGAVGGEGQGLSDVSSPFRLINGREVPQPPIREVLRASYKSTLSKTAGWAKNFGILTALFGGIDCVIEKYRGKHDVWNPVLSGCVVGATLSASGGPAAACIGCAGFAGFSLVVDKIMGPH